MPGQLTRTCAFHIRMPPILTVHLYATSSVSADLTTFCRARGLDIVEQEDLVWGEGEEQHATADSRLDDDGPVQRYIVTIHAEVQQHTSPVHKRHEAMANTTLAPSDDACYTLQLHDTHGDGWNGARWTWSSDSEKVFELTTGSLTSGFSGTETLCFSADCHVFEVGGWPRPEEISWTITNDEGAVAASGGADTTVDVCNDRTERKLLLPFDDAGESLLTPSCFA